MYMCSVKCKTPQPKGEVQCKETRLWNPKDLDMESLIISMTLGRFLNLFFFLIEV